MDNIVTNQKTSNFIGLTGTLERLPNVISGSILETIEIKML